MKHLFTNLIGAMLCLLVAQTAQAQLILTAVYDGPITGGTPKGVELYVTEDIADLSIYGLGSANNGEGTDGEEFEFPNVALTEGDFIYVANEATNFTNFFGFAPDYTNYAMSVNGNDAIELFKNGAVIDVFGEITHSGNPSWDHIDGWVYRLDNSGPDGTTFVAGNWDIEPGALIGCTDNGCVDGVPIGTFSFVLPVELIDFSAEKQADIAALSWTTASEENNAYFDIQRAGSDMRFESLSTVEGQLTTNLVSEYSFEDLNPIEGVNYYRLVQVDVDGTTTVLPTRALDFTSKDKIICYPNPASDVLNIQGVKAGANYTVLNVTGLVLKTGLMSTDQITIDDLPAGMHYLQVQQGLDVTVKPFIKK